MKGKDYLEIGWSVPKFSMLDYAAGITLYLLVCKSEEYIGTNVNI